MFDRLLDRHLLAPTLAILLGALTLSPVNASSVSTPPAHPTPAADSSAVVTDWERVLIRTVFTENTTPIPVGVLYLGFTSVAMYDAVHRAKHLDGSRVAAVATAAHDVLAEYFPASAANLAADLADTLADVPDGAFETRGIRAGATAAERMIQRREDDGRGDTSIVYDRDPAPGVWQPPPGGAMLAPWLGYVDKLVVRRPLRVNGPDPITSWDYTMDFHEVKRLGSAGSTYRSAFQTDTAHFFNSNSATMVGEALIRHLEANPMGIRSAARLFARMHGAMTDSVIECWRLKYEVGFWRPSEAIVGAGGDGNPATVPDPAWAPLIANPPYSDYISGHGSLTAPAIEVIRRTLGEETELTLISTNPLTTDPERTYTTLSEIEHDAFNARIWSGLHFRDAMEDAYRLGHVAGRQAVGAIR